MELKQFTLGQWGVSNDWAIKIKKISKGYEVMYVEEKDCIKDNITFTDDHIINIDLDMFIAMRDNNLFKDFIEKGGSALKASDTSKDVLDNIATTTGKIFDMKKKELVSWLSQIKLGEPRYMGKDQRPDLEVLYKETILNEENPYGDESTANEYEEEGV